MTIEGVNFCLLSAERMEQAERRECMSNECKKRAKMTGFFAELFRDERGQSTVEYILMLSAVVMIAMKFKSTFQQKIGGMVDTVTGDIEKGLKNE